VSECPDVKITNDGLTRSAEHMMHYSYTRTATVGVKWVKTSWTCCPWHHIAIVII